MLKLNTDPQPGMHLEVEVKTVVRQVDVYQFVSFFGGSLGLFLGFAIYDTLLKAYKFALKLWEQRKNMRLVDLELIYMHFATRKFHSNPII